MKISQLSLIALFISLLIVVACHQQNDANPCTYPHRVSIDTSCTTGNGVTLTASDYGDSPAGFEWTIYALKDSSSVLGWTPKDLKIDMFAPDTFTVPDSLTTTYKRLIVTVATNCQGLEKHSIGYGFIKTKSATGNCTIWRPQTF